MKCDKKTGHDGRVMMQKEKADSEVKDFQTNHNLSTTTTNQNNGLLGQLVATHTKQRTVCQHDGLSVHLCCQSEGPDAIFVSGLQLIWLQIIIKCEPFSGAIMYRTASQPHKIILDQY